MRFRSLFPSYLFINFWQLLEGQTLEIHRKNNGFWKIFKFQCLRKLLPKWSDCTPRINSKINLKPKKNVSQNELFSMLILYEFLINLGPQNHLKMRSWASPALPRALPDHLLDAPGVKKPSRTQFLLVYTRFGMNFGRIWAPTWSAKRFQSKQICFLASYTLSSSPEISTSQPQASNHLTITLR